MPNEEVKEYVVYMYYEDVPHEVFYRRHFHKGKQFKGQDKKNYENTISHELCSDVCVYHVKYLRTVFDK